MRLEPVIVAAVSGGPDSMYLLHRLLSGKKDRIVVGHLNHGARGRDSERDQEFVERIAESLRLEHAIGKGRKRNPASPGFEKEARIERHEFLRRLAAKTGSGRIALAHTADDQVETVLMRFFEGAGIGGLKGIPRKSEDGIVRPILDEWREDILKYLKRHMIPCRTDKSNFDTRFERNWVRHVLLPLLEKRYGKSVRKRIFTLGERFREIDDYLETEARKWIRRNVKSGRGSGSITLRRIPFSDLPSVLRIRILQNIGFDRLGLSPNERLLMAMDRSIRDGGPSARVKIGKGWELSNRYGETMFVHHGKPGRENGMPSVRKDGGGGLVVEARGKLAPALAKRVAARGNAELFDAAVLKLPLALRPLTAGDRIRPFGLASEKKVKEVLIDRKIPRGERWGRPAVCDAEGTLLWIPGVVRSAHAPVTARTRKTVLLKLSPPK